MASISALKSRINPATAEALAFTVQYLMEVGVADTNDIDAEVASRLGFTEDETKVVDGANHNSVIFTRLGYVRTDLKNEGLIENIGYGVWSIADKAYTVNVGEIINGIVQQNRMHSKIRKNKKRTLNEAKACLYEIAETYPVPVRRFLFGKAPEILDRLRKGENTDTICEDLLNR